MMLADDIAKILARDPVLEQARWTTSLRVLGVHWNHWAWEQKYSLRFSVPIRPEELAAAWLKGMLRKADLEDGRYYWGVCRNARVSKWSAVKGEFIHMRFKWRWYAEAIPYPGDEEIIAIMHGRLVGHDIFVPWMPVEPLPFERVP